MDFTPTTYLQLIATLREAGYAFVTMPELLARQGEKVVCLRHDIDKRPECALRMAEIEHQMGIRATYFVRTVLGLSNTNMLQQLVALGHEIGYHYEDLVRAKGDTEKALCAFRKHLQYLRAFYPVESICMHGSPQSDIDPKDLWKEVDYHEEGITIEPYLDLDYSRVFYLTDTGRRWDGYQVSVRDKIPQYQEEWNRLGLSFHTTQQLIRALREGKIAAAFDAPHSLLITTHPQRWCCSPLRWFTEYLLQLAKNGIKRLCIKRIEK